MNQIPYEILKSTYKSFVSNHYTVQSSIGTTMSDTFFLWRKSGPDAFWKAMRGDDQVARELLLEALRASTDSDPEKQISGLLSKVRLFRQFMDSESQLRSLSKIKECLNLYGFDSEILGDRKGGPYINIGSKKVLNRAQFWCPEKDGKVTVDHWAGRESGVWYAFAMYSRYRKEWNGEEEVHVSFPDVETVIRYIGCLGEVCGLGWH